MSDETPTPTDPPAEAPAAAAAAAVADAPIDGAGAGTEMVEVAAVPPVLRVPVERPTFRSKFLMPLLVPLAVAATIVFYVLNVSRIFLANDDALAVTFASVITVLILAGGSTLAARPRLRSSSLTMLLGGGFLLLLMGGFISIGAASPSVASGPVQCAPIKQKITIQAGVGGALRFGPSDPTVKAGCVQITLDIVNSSHTFQFDSGAASNAFPTLTGTSKTWAAVLPVGKYPFHCTIPGHETAGMVGVLTVT